jgi:ubiquitin-activating enzyme E1
MAKKMSKKPEDLNLSVVDTVSRYSRCSVTSMATFLGGIVAQEVIKSIGKYTPLY